MPKQTMILSVRGSTSTWRFPVLENPKYLREWQAQGVDIVPADVPLVGKLYSIMLWGASKRYDFTVWGDPDPKVWRAMTDDGLDIDEIIYLMPASVERKLQELGAAPLLMWPGPAEFDKDVELWKN